MRKLIRFVTRVFVSLLLLLLVGPIRTLAADSVPFASFMIPAYFDGPVAVNDEASTTPGTTINIAVLDNDLYDHSSPVTIRLVGIGYRSITVNVDGTVEYRPTDEFKGIDQFSYFLVQGSDSSDYAFVTVTVVDPSDNNHIPLAKDDSVTIPKGRPVTIDVLGNDTDPDGDVITILEVGNALHGSAVSNMNQTAVLYTPDEGFFGFDMFIYSITDGRGGSSSATVIVDVQNEIPPNDSPLATTDSTNTNEDTPVTIAVLANDSDPNGDDLTVEQVSTPFHGKVSIESNVAVRYVPNTNFYGEDSFDYVVTDGYGGEDVGVVFITIKPVNDAPVAAHDEVTTQEDVAIEIDVLANDMDIEGDVLRLLRVGEPANGQTEILATNRIQYTPNSSFNGLDRFAYVVSDGKWGTDEGEVVVTVEGVNIPPIARNDTLQILEDSPVLIQVLKNDEDDENNFLVSVSRPPQFGSVILVGEGAFVKTDQVFAYAPHPDYAGSDRFTYRIEDSGGLTDSAQVLITIFPVNDPPDPPSILMPEDHASVLVGGNSTSSSLDAKALFEVQWEDAQDPEGDSLSYAWHLSSTADFRPESIVFYQEAEEAGRLSIEYGALATALTSLGVERESSIELYHRVIASDGELATPSAVFQVEMFRGSITRDETTDVLPEHFVLHGSYPNPFNPSCTISFDLSADAEVQLEAFDIMGRLVAKSSQEHMTAGFGRSITLDATGWLSGLYVYRLTVRDGQTSSVATGSVTLVK